MSLPKLQYIQKIKVHNDLAEMYQQFLLKLTAAHQQLDIEKQWKVYEDPFTIVRNHREFVFIRPLSSWSDIDNISKEKPISKIIAEAFGESEAMHWLKVVQRAVKSISTQVLAQNELSET